MDVFAAHSLSCPLTLGRRTTMSETAWLKACAVALKPRPAFSGGRPPAPPKICGLCKGEHRPNELEIIEMAKWNCEACGEEKTLSSNRGKKVCSSCAALYGAAANRPELVLQILRELKPELLDERLPEQGNTDELERQLYQSRELLDELEGKLLAVNGQYEKLNEEYDDLSDNADELREEAAAAKHALQLAEERIEALERKLSSKSNESDSALLDLALDALKGEITGLKPERIEAMRGMA